jgi:hypothetical protein
MLVDAPSVLGWEQWRAMDTGILQVWSNPALNDDWGDWCVFDGAGSDGWVGLYIGEYVVDGGGFVGAPVDQQVRLWSDSSWWSGVGSQEGSNSGYPLFAQLNVDNDHHVGTELS